MLYVFNVVLPVFALILVGYICGKSGKLGERASTELNRFVVWLALPAQLFNFAANSTWQSLWQPGFILAFAVSCLVVYFLTFFISWYRIKYVRESSEGERLVVKINSHVSEDEIYDDFAKIYRRYRALYRQTVGDYFFKETEDLIDKLCDDFEGATRNGSQT